MAHEPAHTKKAPILSLNVISVVDLARLQRELDDLEDFSLQSSVRDAGKQPTLPRTSRSLEDLASQNELNLLIEADRQKLRQILADLKKTSPVIHFSFATDPNQTFLVKLVTWLRNEIHPSVLISVGLQPGIAAGCIVRTDNKYFDLSLRKYLSENTQLLGKSIMERQ